MEASVWIFVFLGCSILLLNEVMREKYEESARQTLPRPGGPRSPFDRPRPEREDNLLVRYAGYGSAMAGGAMMGALFGVIAGSVLCHVRNGFLTVVRIRPLHADDYDEELLNEADERGDRSDENSEALVPRDRMNERSGEGPEKTQRTDGDETHARTRNHGH